MANNEALAMALAVACVWAAASSRSLEADAGRERKWLLLAALLGGLALLTKLTSVGGVFAAAWLVAHGRPRRGALGRGAAIVGGAALLRLHGALVPLPISHPAFPEGLWALTLRPIEVLNLSLSLSGLFASGLLLPSWLVTPYAFTYFPILATGWASTLWVLWMGCKRRELSFVGAGFLALGFLLLAQVLFRDLYAGLFLARYSPTATALVSLLVAAVVATRSPRLRRGLFVAWAAFALAFAGYIFYFLYLFAQPVTKWKW